MLVLLVAFVLLASSNAERPEETSMCDFYSHSILGNNTESNQGLLMQLLTNTAIIGNYTTPNVGIKVAGFAALGEYMGQEQYFGQLLGCSKQGGDDFPSYKGKASMYEVHKFMDLSYAENSYLIQQFSQSAASLGFSAIDVAKFNSALDFLFTFQGAPSITLIPASAGEQLQAVCIYEDCPLYPEPDLDAYPNHGVPQPPSVVNQTLVGNATVKSTRTQTPTPTVDVHYGCVGPRDIVDRAASTACASGASVTGSAATSTSTSGADGSTINL
ncbi:hypothetical protein DV737_g304, partial [Chaetothyriales sp. CBS 132003]